MTIVIAHRGASAARPENTVEAFRHARELGAEMVELDARRAADGTLWVLHDAHLEDGRALVETLPADLPGHIPTLAQALDACEGMDINIEVKNSEPDPDFDADERVATAVAALIQERALHARVIVSSFNMASVDAVHQIDPTIPTAWLTYLDVSPEAIAAVAEHGHQALHPHWMLVDDEVVANAHERGLQVNVWTCDDPGAMARMVQMGVDGICTNVPDVARQVIDGT
jgi:glycerophosphoryl diester phosphodiesterase